MIAGLSIVTGFTTRLVEQEKDVGTKTRGVWFGAFPLFQTVITAQRSIRLHPDHSVKIEEIYVRETLPES